MKRGFWVIFGGVTGVAGKFCRVGGKILSAINPKNPNKILVMAVCHILYYNHG
jgi:hypothetical protein